MNKEILKNQINLKKIRCCNQFYNQKILLADQALDYKYIQFNYKNPQWLIFDIDNQPTCPEEITKEQEEHPLALPIATLITRNKKSGNSHYLYKLSHYINSSNPKELKYYKDVQKKMSIYLNADSSYNHQLTQNPLHPQFETYWHDEAYDLYDLNLDFISLSKDTKKSIFDTKSDMGRNCYIFNEIRHLSYRTKRKYTDFDRFHNFILTSCEQLNNKLTYPLPYSEIKATAQSIARWTWNNYTGLTKRGRDSLKNVHLSALSDKQSLSAIETNKQRKKHTQQLIDTAIDELKANNKKITNYAITKKTKLSKNTVKKYHLSIVTP